MEIKEIRTEHLKIIFDDLTHLRMKVYYMIGDKGFDLWDELGFIHNAIDAEIQRRQQTA